MLPAAGPCPPGIPPRCRGAPAPRRAASGAYDAAGGGPRPSGHPAAMPWGPCPTARRKRRLRCFRRRAPAPAVRQSPTLRVTLPPVRHRRLTVPFLVAVLVVVAGGCSGGGTKRAEKGATVATAPAASAEPTAVTVRAHEYGFDTPAEIEGGVGRLTLQNDGKLKHEAVVVAAGDTPLDRVRQDLTPVVKGEGNPTAPYLHFEGGVSLVPPGSSVTSTLTLPPGKYVLVCSLTDADSVDAADRPPKTDAERFHYDLGMATPFTVKTTNTATMPPTDGTIVARDYAFDLPPLAPGTLTLTLRNDGQQDHSLAVSEFPDGVDAGAAKAAFEALLAATPDHPPPDDVVVPDDVAFAGPLSAGGRTTFTMH